MQITTPELAGFSQVWPPNCVAGPDLKSLVRRLCRILTGGTVAHRPPGICIQMSAAPDINVNLPLTPVDYVSDTIIHISRQTKAIGKCFNLTNKNTTNFKTIVKFTKKAGYNIEILPYDEWIKKLTESSFEKNVLSILSRLFTDKRKDGEGITERYGNRQAHIDTSNTETLLEGSEIKCLPIDEKMFHNYLELFTRMGYISKNRQNKNTTANTNNDNSSQKQK